MLAFRRVGYRVLRACLIPLEGDQRKRAVGVQSEMMPLRPKLAFMVNELSEVLYYRHG